MTRDLEPLQNLSWLPKVSRQVQRLRLWLRPALIPLVKQRFCLPSNCALEPMSPHREPWAQGIPQVGTYYLPIVMRAWTESGRDGGRSYLRGRIRKLKQTPPRIGLVWSAGHHKAPQPERSARCVTYWRAFQLAQSGKDHRASGESVGWA